MTDLNPTFTLPELSLESLLYNLALGAVLSSLIAWHYSRRAFKKGLRRELSFVLPVICLTTLLVISVVKSSLALSLGLVGALSIVRFRTPIKEPEELTYIFLVIALGLALGADQREVAAFSIPLVLGFISVSSIINNRKSEPTGNLFITIEVPRENNSDTKLDDILSSISEICPSIDIRKIHQDKMHFMIVAYMNFENKLKLSKFSEDFNNEYPNGRFTLMDDSSLPVE
jgi:uncharacterized membrane protein YhiD involved in acid resistance